MAGEGWGMSAWGGVLTFGGGGGGGGGGGPTVVNFSPPAGTPIDRGTALEFDVMNPNPLIAIVVSIVYRDTGATELVYNREGFSANFAPTGGFIGSERNAIVGGTHFILRRRGGWPLAPSILIEGSDDQGNPVPAT
jgi:hypothetical protein